MSARTASEDEGGEFDRSESGMRRAAAVAILFCALLRSGRSNATGGVCVALRLQPFLRASEERFERDERGVRRSAVEEWFERGRRVVSSRRVARLRQHDRTVLSERDRAEVRDPRDEPDDRAVGEPRDEAARAYLRTGEEVRQSLNTGVGAAEREPPRLSPTTPRHRVTAARDERAARDAAPSHRHDAR